MPKCVNVVHAPGRHAKGALCAYGGMGMLKSDAFSAEIHGACEVYVAPYAEWRVLGASRCGACP